MELSDRVLFLATVLFGSTINVFVLSTANQVLPTHIIGMIGEPCKRDKNCLTEQMMCSNNMCQCITGHYPSSDKKNCIATVGAECDKPVDCQSLPNSECDLQKKCACTEGFLPSADNRQCLPKAEYNEECKENIQCVIPNTICDNKCVCQKGYEWKHSNCIKFKGLGDPCMNSSECYDNITTCINNTCDCNELFVRARNKTNTCLEKAEYNMYCQEDHQCMKNNTACERMRCVCKMGYKWNKSDCIKNKAQLRTDFIWFITSLSVVFSRYI